MSIYEQGLGRAAVNHVALSPLSFIERTAAVYPHYPAVVHGSIRRNWAETYARCRRLASALAGRGIGQGDTVAVMLPNIPAMLEAHFGVPMIGAVLNTLNVRLDAEAIAFMLQHGEAKVVIADREFFDVIHAAIGMLDHPPLVIDVDDPEYGEGQAVSDLWTTRPSSPKATPSSPGSGRRTSGRPSASTTPPALPATPRAWSITTAAPSSTPWATR